MALFFLSRGVKTANILGSSMPNGEVGTMNYNRIDQWDKKQTLMGVLEEINGPRQKYLGRAANIGNIPRHFCSQVPLQVHKFVLYYIKRRGQQAIGGPYLTEDGTKTDQQEPLQNFLRDFSNPYLFLLSLLYR